MTSLKTNLNRSKLIKPINWCHWFNTPYLYRGVNQ